MNISSSSKCSGCKGFSPVGGVVVLADVELAVGAQDAHRGLPITRLASVDITAAAHH